MLASNNKREKLNLLGRVLEEGGKVGRTLVFVKKKATARWVSKQVGSDAPLSCGCSTNKAS